MSSTRLVSLLGAAAIVISLPAHAQLTPSGDELTISSSTDKNRQQWPAVGVSAADTRLAWEDDSLGVVTSVVAKPELGASPPEVLVANDPLPEQKPFRVNLREQHQPALAVHGDGSFLLVWTEATIFRNVSAAYVDERTPVSSRVLGRQFGADGQPRGNAFEIAGDKGTPARPVLAADGDVTWIAWEEPAGAAAGVHFRSLDAKGRLGKEVLAGAGGRNAALAVAGTSILVAWDHNDDEQGKSTAFVRLFKPSGSPLGAAIEVGSAGTSAGFPAAAASRNGDFFVAWQGGPDATFRDSHVYGQLLRLKGSAVTRVGTPQLLSIGDGNRHLIPLVATLNDGGWLAGWVAWKGLVPLAVDVARLDAAGAVVGQPLRLNDRRPFELGTIAMAAQPERIWTSWVSVGPDGHSRIRARVAVSGPNTPTTAAATH